MSAHIIIRFEPDGKIKIEGQEFKGPACEKAMAFLESSLGKVKSKKRKPEYAMACQTQKATQ